MEKLATNFDASAEKVGAGILAVRARYRPASPPSRPHGLPPVWAPVLAIIRAKRTGQRLDGDQAAILRLWTEWRVTVTACESENFSRLWPILRTINRLTDSDDPVALALAQELIAIARDDWGVTDPLTDDPKGLARTRTRRYDLLPVEWRGR